MVDCCEEYLGELQSRAEAKRREDVLSPEDRNAAWPGTGDRRTRTRDGTATLVWAQPPGRFGPATGVWPGGATATPLQPAIGGILMLCCTECFSDEYLRKYIAESDRVGDCEYCHASGVKCVEATDLRELFEPLMALYVEATLETTRGEPIDVGEPLADVIDREWRVFSDAACNCRQEILCGIFPSNPKEAEWGPEGNLYVEDPDTDWQTRPSEEWDRFVEHITKERRFIVSRDRQCVDGPPEVSDPRDWLPRALGVVSMPIDSSTPVWRARLWDDPLVEPDARKPPCAKWLGAPGPENAVAGRANSVGIPVFYGAMSEGTAKREVRPAVGAHVWVAEWRPRAPGKVAKLSNVPYLRSPFGLGDIAAELEKRSFLRAVSSALSVPVSPHEERFRYVPTQYVVEVIKDAGYDGVAYASSQDPNGRNIVLFDPSCLRCTSNRRLVKAESVCYRFSEPLD